MLESVHYKQRIQFTKKREFANVSLQNMVVKCSNKKMSVKCCVMRLVCCFCVCMLVTSRFRRSWLAEMRKGELSVLVSLSQYITSPRQVLCSFLLVVTDGNLAPRGSWQNYKGDGKMGLVSLGRQLI
jgi:hypothetical protein